MMLPLQLAATVAACLVAPPAVLRLGAPELVGRSEVGDRAAPRLDHYWFPNSGAATLGGQLILPIRSTCDTPCFNRSGGVQDAIVWRARPNAPLVAAAPALLKSAIDRIMIVTPSRGYFKKERNKRSFKKSSLRHMAP